MLKLTVKEQNLQQALGFVKMERYDFSERTYHRLQGRISVGHTNVFEFIGAYNKGQISHANSFFNNPLTDRQESIERFLCESAGIKSTKALYNTILKLEKKTETLYLDDYTREFAKPF